MQMMENPNEITILDVLELAHSLRQEQLSIANEKNAYIRLNENLIESTSNTSQVSLEFTIIIEFCHFLQI
jgi:hypothetical protein